MSPNETVLSRICHDIKKYLPILCLIGLYIVVMSLVAGKVCPVRIAIGIPCPGCGITRSLWLLCQGQIAGSIKIHPMGIWMVPGMILAGYERYVPGSGKKWGQAYLVIWSIACVAVYIWRMVFWYPNIEPMLHDSKNLLQWIKDLIM